MPHCGYKYTELAELKICTRTNRNSFCLPEAERLVLMFILDRTIGWHRVWEFISNRQFVDGVSRRRRGRDVLVIRGTGLMSGQVDEALTCLLERNAIAIGQFGRKMAYKVNEHWCHPDLEDQRMWEVNESDYRYADDQTGEEE